MPSNMALPRGCSYHRLCRLRRAVQLILSKLGGRTWLPILMVAWGRLPPQPAGQTPMRCRRRVCLLGRRDQLLPACLRRTLWFPGTYRARMLTILGLSTPFSLVLGSLVSGPILLMDGIWGFAGWQWLFVLQALPTIALGLVFWQALPEGPAQARWLPHAEKQWLVDKLAQEQTQREEVRRFSVGTALTSRIVWLGGLAGAGINGAAYGLILFLPQMIHALGISTAMTPLVNAIPFVVVSAVMMWWASHSDRTGERNWHAALPAAIAGVSLISCAVLTNPLAVMVALTIGLTGVFCYVSVFWAIPSSMLSGAAAAAGLALINALANIGSYFGPYLVGWVKNSTGSFALGIMLMGCGPMVSAVIAMSLRETRKFKA
ncbi:MAG: MFS transporter [Alphaproteobacteria bacterium]